MTVVGIHPEELFDKLLEGQITSVERERLRAHLDGCQVCRFEYQARLDFQDEARVLRASSPPALAPLRHPQTLPLVSRRRRSRLLVLGLAAAALISASGAVASGVTGKPPWQTVSLLLSRTATPQQQPATFTLKQAPQAACERGEACAGAGQAASRAPEAVPAVVEEHKLPSVGAEAARAWRGEGRARGVSAAPAGARAAAVTAKAIAAVPAIKEPVSKEPNSQEPVSAAKLFGEANQARRSGDVGRASSLYHVLQDQFAGSAEAELSRVTLALLLLDSGDAQGALSGFERYLAGASRGLEAEALVGRARALGRLGRRDLEATAWQEVQRKYPRSIYGRQASERLSALGQP